MCKLRDKATVKICQPKRDLSSFVFFGTGQVETALVFSGKGATPLAEYSNPKWVVVLFPKSTWSHAG